MYALDFVIQSSKSFSESDVSGFPKMKLIIHSNKIFDTLQYNIIFQVI